MKEYVYYVPELDCLLVDEQPWMSEVYAGLFERMDKKYVYVGPYEVIYIGEL